MVKKNTRAKCKNAQIFYRIPNGLGGLRSIKKTGKYAGLIEFVDRGKQQMAVVNPKGKLPIVNIVETSLPGFTVRYARKPYRIISSGHRKAELLAFRLAKKGHKLVRQM